MNRTLRVSFLVTVIGLGLCVGCSKPAPTTTKAETSVSSIKKRSGWQVFADDNKQLVKLMQDIGDKLEVERSVTYYSFFDKLEDAQSFSRESTGAGFNLAGEQREDGQIRVETTKVHDARLETIDKWSKWVYDCSVKNHGEFDGWDCDPEK